MHAAHRRPQCQSQAEQVPHFTVVDVAGQGGHQHHAQAGGGAGLHGQALQVQAGSAAHGLEHGFAHAVPLQVHGIQTRGPQPGGVARVPPQTQAVGIELHQAEAALPRQRHYGGQILANGGLPAGNLHIAGPGGRFQTVQLRGQRGQGRIGRRGLLCAARSGIANRTGQIATHGHFHQAGASVLGVQGAEPAVKGAAPRHSGTGLLRVGGTFGPRPGLERRRIHNAGYDALCINRLKRKPGRHAEHAMFRAGFAQKDALLRPRRFRALVHGLNTAQTDGAQALRAAQNHGIGPVRTAVRSSS